MIQLFKIISVIACHSNPDCYISGHIVRKLDPRQDILFLFLSNHLYNKKTTTVKQSSILDNTHMLHFNLSCPHYVIRATGCLLRNHKERRHEQDQYSCRLFNTQPHETIKVLAKSGLEQRKSCSQNTPAHAICWHIIDSVN